MTAGNTTLVAPNERLAAGELVDVELECLRNIGLRDIEINVIGEMMQ
jgi:hypothetical protein